MRLGADEERVQVAGQLDVLDQPAVRRRARHEQTGVLQLGPVVVVHLVPVPVPGGDLHPPVRLGDERAGYQLLRVRAQPHRAAHVALAGDDVDLVGHRGDDRVRGLRVELGGVRVLQPGQVPGGLDHHALQTEAEAERRDASLARVPDRADLSLDAADPEAAGDQHTVHTGQRGRGAGGSGTVVRRHPADLDPGPVREPAGPQGLGDRQVRVRQVDVLADQRDRDRPLRTVHPVEQVAPDRPVHVPERQSQPADHVRVEALGVQDLRDVVDGRGVHCGHHAVGVHVAHQRDLALQPGRQLPVGPADDRVRLDADRAQRGHRVLGRLGLQLPARGQVGHKRDVQEEAVVPTHVVAQLPGGLKERQRLDVADRAADLGDDHVRRIFGARGRLHPVLDLVGDVRDHLHGVAQVFPAALLGDHRRVDLAGRDVGRGPQVGVEEPLVVTDVEVGLGTVLGDVDLAVLERVHRPGIDVEVRVELLHRHPQPPALEQAAEAARREALAERGRDAPGDEDVLGLATGLRQGGLPRSPCGPSDCFAPAIHGSSR